MINDNLSHMTILPVCPTSIHVYRKHDIILPQCLVIKANDVYRILTYASIYHDVKYITQCDDFRDMSNVKTISQPPGKTGWSINNI